MKHTVTLLVQNNPRVLSRITSLFARRGFNIESLAVGRTHEAEFSRISFVVNGDDQTIEQVEKQLFHLIEVIRITDHTEPHVARELALVKVHIAGIEERLEIKEIAEAYRARIVDVARHTLVLEVTGETNKIEGMIEQLRPYGILESVRTGVVAMSRGERAIQGVKKEEKVS
jgi:acetolactate synthase-1/3 small subunit